MAVRRATQAHHSSCAELYNPKVLTKKKTASRSMRIAQGSGRSVGEVKELLEEFNLGNLKQRKSAGTIQGMPILPIWGARMGFEVQACFTNLARAHSETRASSSGGLATPMGFADAQFGLGNAFEERKNERPGHLAVQKGCCTRHVQAIQRLETWNNSSCKAE